MGEDIFTADAPLDDALLAVDDAPDSGVDDALRGLGDEEEFEADFDIEDDEDEEDEDEGFEFDLDGDGGDDPAPAGFEVALGGAQAPAGKAVEEGPVDLNMDQQMAIDLAFDGIENKTFYEILLLPRTGDEKAIKRSYYRLSKEYHPDKFYRKNLGPYKEKLEVIFNKVNEAYRVLSDLEARDDYDVLVFGKEGKDAASPTEATTTVNFVVDAERLRAAEKSSKGKLNPAAGKKKKKKAPAKFMQNFQKQVALRVAKAKRHMREGQAAADAGNHQEAASHFQAAMTLDPRNVRANALYKKSSAQHRNTKAEGFYKQAQDALLAEDTKRAAELMQKAVDCKPTRGKYYNEFGKLVTEHTLQQRVGLELLRKAVELESRNVDYTLDLAKAYEGLGMPSNAVRAFERVLHLDSRRSEAAKALKRLK